MANTAPFWAAIFARCLIDEGIRCLEIVAMIVSFGAVCLITWSKSSDEEGEKERMLFQDSAFKAGLLGCSAILVKGMLQGLISV